MSNDKTSENSEAPAALRALAAYGSLAFTLAAGFIVLQVIVPTFYAQALGLTKGPRQ